MVNFAMTTKGDCHAQIYEPHDRLRLQGSFRKCEEQEDNDKISQPGTECEGLGDGYRLRRQGEDTLP